MSDDELQGFGDDAIDAVTMAEIEARELGHDRVGTEHLLLGLLANGEHGTDGARQLLAAGATLNAARHKVTEAVGAGVEAGELPIGPLPRTARAARALTRSVRFSHARRSAVVTTEHVLLGVLDVEGNAGQVLRGLGVDVDRLRAAFDPEPAPGETAGEAVERPLACPSCHTLLDEELRYHFVTATDGSGGSVDTLVFACGGCGRVLGVSPG